MPKNNILAIRTKSPVIFDNFLQGRSGGFLLTGDDTNGLSITDDVTNTGRRYLTPAGISFQIGRVRVNPFIGSYWTGPPVVSGNSKEGWGTSFTQLIPFQ